VELANLSETAGRAKFFQRGVLLNLAYWQDWVKNNANDVAILDQERNGLIRGILFALDLGEMAWSSVQELISTLSSYMERRGYWEIWHQVLDKALKVAGLVGDLAGMTHLSALLGRLSFQQSHFQESVSYYRQTIRLARQIGDRFNEARACTNLGYYTSSAAVVAGRKCCACMRCNCLRRLTAIMGERIPKITWGAFISGNVGGMKPSSTLSEPVPSGRQWGYARFDAGVYQSGRTL